ARPLLHGGGMFLVALGALQVAPVPHVVLSFWVHHVGGAVHPAAGGVPRTELLHATNEAQGLVVMDLRLAWRTLLHAPDVLTQRETKVEVIPVQLADSLRTLLRFRQRHEDLVEVGGAHEKGWM